ncbi:MAG TPA: alpha/beta fold hydrolase [Dehalococcoidia bacterium]|nr:alpha/beta fold hydrolase [Dehalococcoidia bacterium]
MPSEINHLRVVWTSPIASIPLRQLAQRFTLVTYDSRGQGMSSRGLPENHAIEDFERDLEAVIDHLRLDRVFLWSYGSFSYVAARFAVRHPERVAALILWNPLWKGMPDSWLPFIDIASRDWNLFLITLARTFVPFADADETARSFSESVIQRDWLTIANARKNTTFDGLVGRLLVPTLVMASDDGVRDAEEDARRIAAAIPGALLASFPQSSESLYTRESPSPVTRAIEAFVKEIATRPSGPQPPAASSHLSNLSPRELEVLRLVAAGKSNQQIADELVISLFTVNRHVSNIYAKTGVANRVEATTYAARNGLL